MLLALRDLLQLGWQFHLGMFVLEMLLVRLWVGHLGLAHCTGKYERLLGCLHLVTQAVALLFLQLGILLLGLLLGLDLLVSTGHFCLF